VDCSTRRFEGDEDPELVAAAIPFGLKLYESLLAESPKHRGLADELLESQAPAGMPTIAPLEHRCCHSQNTTPPRGKNKSFAGVSHFGARCRNSS
jgi:hypothetical protein